MVFWIIIILFIILFLSSLFFVLPSLSVIPYYPTNKKDLKKIITLLNLKNNKTIIDLGAGNGTVIFAAAKAAYQQNLNTKFIALEINPILTLILYLSRFFHPNKKNIQIKKADIFNFDYSQFSDFKNITFYIYISPWLINKLIKKIKKDIHSFQLISYMYPLQNKKADKLIKGIHNIYKYVLT